MESNNTSGNPIDEKAKEFTLNLLKQEKAPDFIVEKLVANGYNYDHAVNYVYPLVESLENAAAAQGKKNSTLDIVLGAVILFIGLFITFASKNVIAYGAIIYGAFRLFRGIINAIS